jgi:NADH:ubiquinone oxidoreductase subunit E
MKHCMNPTGGLGAQRLVMAAATNSDIFMKNNEKEVQQRYVIVECCCYGICGNKPNRIHNEAMHRTGSKILQSIFLRVSS